MNERHSWLPANAVEIRRDTPIGASAQIANGLFKQLSRSEATYRARHVEFRARIARQRDLNREARDIRVLVGQATD
jgi:hypothetical protein